MLVAVNTNESPEQIVVLLDEISGVCIETVTASLESLSQEFNV